MIVRFCLYSVVKNLRFADPFLVLFLLHLDLSFTEIGLLLGFGSLLTGLLEIPSGFLADRWGRVRSVAACFLCYAVSFSLFPFAAAAPEARRQVWLYAPVAAFGIAEALRTGGHKAIMLDWLDSRGEGSRTTQVIGMTRAFSKYSAAASALAGGVILFLTRDYDGLFYASAVASVGGFVLMCTYPRDLEGEQRRHARSHAGGPGAASRQTLRERLGAIGRAPGFSFLFARSVMFESQARLMFKYYLQPLLKLTLQGWGFAVVGSGALWVGGYDFARGVLGGLGAQTSARAQRLFGGVERSLRAAFIGGFLLSVGLAVFVWRGWMTAGLVLLVALTVLQNLRRPVFLNAFNLVMDGPQRATTLSIESQARSLVTAVMMPLAGWLIDGLGMAAALGMTSVVFAVGMFVRPIQSNSEARSVD